MNKGLITLSLLGIASLSYAGMELNPYDLAVQAAADCAEARKSSSPAEKAHEAGLKKSFAALFYALPAADQAKLRADAQVVADVGGSIPPHFTEAIDTAIAEVERKTGPARDTAITAAAQAISKEYVQGPAKDAILKGLGK